MEYIILRLIRKFIIKGKILRLLEKFIPYYAPSGNEIGPEPIVDKYESYLKVKKLSLKDKTILEIGSGSTNSTGYSLLKRGAKSITLFEPYASFDESLDSKIKNKILQNYENSKGQITRVSSLNGLTQKFDLILSHSVLEHVTNPEELFSQLKELLTEDGVMLHIADFRDHFFKYPYHFLKYSSFVWDTFLNPGDLPRWRKYDYIYIYDKLGLKYEILEESSMLEEYKKVEKKVHPSFQRKNPDIHVGYCVFWIKV